MVRVIRAVRGALGSRGFVGGGLSSGLLTPLGGGGRLGGCVLDIADGAEHIHEGAEEVEAPSARVVNMYKA